jgi:hypothetical protein
MRNIPAATQRFDQLDARRQLFHLEVQCRPLIVQQSGLRGDYIKVSEAKKRLVELSRIGL